MNKQYVLNQAVAIEDFSDESLIFLPVERRMIKINSVSRDILRFMDGQNTVIDIVHRMALTYDISFEQLSEDIKSIIADLTEQHIIRDAHRLTQIKDLEKMDDDTRYNINRDISCRIEDPEGAILFNPETDAVNVINPVGLAIWQALEYPRKKSEIVEYLLDVCEDVPLEQIGKDVDEFINKLSTAGFIGVVIE